MQEQLLKTFVLEGRGSWVYVRTSAARTRVAEVRSAVIFSIGDGLVDSKLGGAMVFRLRECLGRACRSEAGLDKDDELLACIAFFIHSFYIHTFSQLSTLAFVYIIPCHSPDILL